MRDTFPTHNKTKNIIEQKSSPTNLWFVVALSISLLPHYTMMRTSILLALFFAGSAAGQDACANVDCHLGAPCVAGEADFSEHPTNADGTPLEMHHVTNINSVHCECPHGWTGVTCNRIYNSCDGDHKCYNGGQCVPGLLDYYGNEQLFCDCSDAKDAEGFPFVGKFCEHASKETCDQENQFCVNGGECNLEYPNTGTPCDCMDGFEGPHCEFKVGTTPKCTLTCANAGVCKLGPSSDVQNFHDLVHLHETDGSAEDIMHCLCPPGYGGKLCDVEKTKDKCGSHHCYHGGTCISRIDSDGVNKYHCDCATAHNATTSFAGRFCQYESSSFCSKGENQNGQLFCTNGGKCSDDDFDGCECVGDFYGPSCEFKHLPPPVTVSAPPVNINMTNHPTAAPILEHNGLNLDDLAACKITCTNGGKCRKGNKDLGVIANIAPHVSELNQTSNENFEHCVCQPGYVGLHCEHKIELCPHSEHVCLHGSKCVKFGDEHSCDCSSSSDYESLSGKSCQHKNSQMCTENVEPVQPRSFCVNGGTCKNIVSGSDTHPGCNCVGMFNGPHCELHKSVEIPHPDAIGGFGTTAQSVEQPPPVLLPPPTENGNSNNSGGGNSGATGVLVVGIIALLVSAVVSVGSIISNRKYRRRMEKQQLAMAIAAHSDTSRSSSSELELKPINFAAGEPEVYIGPPRDEDGHELHNVEII